MFEGYTERARRLPFFGRYGRKPVREHLRGNDQAILEVVAPMLALPRAATSATR